MSCSVLLCCRVYWRLLLVILTPVILVPMIIPFSERSQESKCGYIIIVMTIFWVTETFPLPVTSLIPIAVAPMLGLASSSKLCKVFFEDISFLLIGGTLVAIAIEETMLHKRIAVRILLFVGVEPRRLLLGVMATTAFLSMWISNMATTAMMLPITRALLAKLLTSTAVNHTTVMSHTTEQPHQDTENAKITIELVSVRPRDENCKDRDVCEEQSLTSEMTSLCNQNGVESEQAQKAEKDLNVEDEEFKVLANIKPKDRVILKIFSLCVCYSANIGGMATLTGTAPNMVLGRMVRDMYKEAPVTFANWFFYGFPTSFLLLSGAYIWMSISAFGFRSTFTWSKTVTRDNVKQTQQQIRQEIDRLGQMKFNEVIVLIHFILLVSLWLFRIPGSFPGWASLFKAGYVTDASVSILVATSLFIFPSRRPNVLFFRTKNDVTPPNSTPSILTWKKAMRKFPWGVIFLCGGGFALSEAIKVSGLSRLIAHNLKILTALPHWVACLLLVILTSTVTEIVSNTVVTMLALPMLKELAVEMNVHPLYLMLPATAASSLAFMLPIATPPNAQVFAYGDIRVMDMMKCGVVLNILGVMFITLGINSWGYVIFKMADIPDWATRLTSDPANWTMYSFNTTASGFNSSLF